jgi:hypothetical protein
MNSLLERLEHDLNQVVKTLFKTMAKKRHYKKQVRKLRQEAKTASNLEKELNQRQVR